MEKLPFCSRQEKLRHVAIPEDVIDEVLKMTADDDQAMDIALIPTEQKTKQSQSAPSEEIKIDEKKTAFFEECKMVFAVRTDLGISTGQIASEVGHAG